MLCVCGKRAEKPANCASIQHYIAELFDDCISPTYKLELTMICPRYFFGQSSIFHSRWLAAGANWLRQMADCLLDRRNGATALLLARRTTAVFRQCRNHFFPNWFQKDKFTNLGQSAPGGQGTLWKFLLYRILAFIKYSWCTLFLFCEPQPFWMAQSRTIEFCNCCSRMAKEPVILDFKSLIIQSCFVDVL